MIINIIHDREMIKLDSKILRSIEIVVVAIAALILTRLSISYIIILALIGLITTLISKRRKDAIIAAVLYTIIGYVISYPAGMFFAQFTPETPIPVSITLTDTIINQAIGVAIPIIIAIIITTVVSSAVIFILNLLGGNKKQKTQQKDEVYFQKPPKQIPQKEVYFNQQQPQQPQQPDEYIQPQPEIPPQQYQQTQQDPLTSQIPIQPKQTKQTTNNKKSNRKSKSRKTKKEKQEIIYHDPITNYKKSKKGE